MTTNTQAILWFQQLETQLKTLEPITTSYGPQIPTSNWQSWSSRTASAIKSTFGDNSPHYINFQTSYKACRGYPEEVDALKGIFLGAKSDLESGFLFSLEATISGELFGNFVEMAKIALGNGFKDSAAVLASAALEDALKSYAKLNGLDANDKTMEEVVNSLKSKGLVEGAQKSLLSVMPRIRNNAMHANWSKITEQEVGSLIGYVEQFLLSKF